MTEHEFEKLLQRSIRSYGHTYIPEEPEEPEPHVFSKRYQRKMRRLERKPRWKRLIPDLSPERRLLTKRVLATQFAVILLFATGSLHAVGRGTYFDNFIAHDHKRGSTIVAAEDPDAPTEFENYYQVTWVPEGYERTYRPLKIPQSGFLRYEYSNAEGNVIIFKQCTKPDFKDSMNTEKVMYERTEINGHEVMFLLLEHEDYADSCRIFMECEGYILTISANCVNITSDDLIRMLESVQEVSWEIMIGVY